MVRSSSVVARGRHRVQYPNNFNRRWVTTGEDAPRFSQIVSNTQFMREKRDLPSCIVRPQSNGSSAVSSVNYNARHIVGTIFDRLNRFCGEKPCGEHYGDAKKPTKPVQICSCFHFQQLPTYAEPKRSADLNGSFHTGSQVAASQLSCTQD